MHSIERWTHTHQFSFDSTQSEHRTRLVIVLTAITMMVEIVVGMLSGSMALLADGWHMGTHVTALSITVFAYRYARHHAHDKRYSFGTGKVSVLGGFTSGVVLAMVAVLMAAESFSRLIYPQLIHFNEAIAVALLGLIVNVISMGLLNDSHHFHDDHDDHHAHDDHHTPHHDAYHESLHHYDHNFKSAYLHVLSDALTSLLAIFALLIGKFLNWIWLDALMGIVGAIIILRWSVGLLRDTSYILLDGQADPEILSEIQQLIESDTNDKISDIHVWRLNSHHLAAIVSIVTHSSRSPEYYKNLLASKKELVHVTVEIYTCECRESK